MHTRLPAPDRRIDTLPYDGIDRRAPHPIVSLGIAGILPATLVGISALLRHPWLAVAILLLLVGVATASRLGPT